MEDLNQAYGFVLYRKQFPNGLKGKLELQKAMDYTIVMVNGKPVGESFVGLGLDSNKIDVNEAGPATLDILVYNLGRISVIVNANSPARARKGLVGGASLDGAELSGWDMYSLPMENVQAIKPSRTPANGPTFYHATFNVDQPAGTFLDMRNWSFGAVWVNGHNLGRYWDRGGLRSLFVPAGFMKPGQNDITILELHGAPKTPEITGGTKIIEEKAVPWPIRLDRAVLAPAGQAPPGGRGVGPAGRRGNAPAPATQPG
jgi:beta-galactosidase